MIRIFSGKEEPQNIQSASEISEVKNSNNVPPFEIHELVNDFKEDFHEDLIDILYVKW